MSPSAEATAATEPVVIEPLMRQQDIGDCVVVCLAMLTGLSYGQVLAAFSKRAKVTQRGVSDRQLVLAARKLGFPLRYIAEGDLSEVVGMLHLKREGAKEWHAVIVAKGVIYNPTDGTLWTDIDSFFRTRQWQPLGVFVRQEGELTR